MWPNVTIPDRAEASVLELDPEKGGPVSRTNAKRCSEKIMFEQEDRAGDEGPSTIHSVFLTENALRGVACCERTGCVLSRNEGFTARD
jgi:hypothetical protein